MIRTDRLSLRPLTRNDLNDFARLHAEPQTMHDLGGPIPRVEAAAKLDRYLAARATHGFCRCHVSDAQGFVGYVGLMPRGEEYPIGPHVEIGWRLLPGVWGKGYATEAASAILRDAFARGSHAEVLSYTGPDNCASQAVMARLGLTRDETRDFGMDDPILGTWHGLVWVASAADWRG